MAANNRFDGMPAVITGGASGIGLAVASRIIAEGGQVTLWDVDQAKLDAAQAKFGPKARAKHVDITNPGAGNCGGQRGVTGLDKYLYGGRRVPGLSSRSPGSHRFYF